MDARRQYWRIGWLWLLLSLSSHLQALQVGVLAPQALPAVEQLVQMLEMRLGRPVVLLSSASDEGADRVDWWVLAGPDALSQMALLRQPSVAVFISRAQWQGIELSENDEQRSAIFVEPPLIRQVNLALLLLGEPRSVGILTSNDDLLIDSPWLENHARITPYVVGQPNSLHHALTQLLRSNAAVVGDYDLSLFSAENIKTILITAYRHNKPLIGPSSAYLRAGALASTYSDVQHVVQRLHDVMVHYQQDGQLPLADYNPHFHVRFNEQVARSLNIPLPDEQDVLRALQHKERQP